MKKFLSITLMMLALVLMLASCNAVKNTIIKHEVTFNLNGGVAGEDYAESVEVEDGKTLTLSTPRREGYHFLGWYSGETKINGSTPVTTDLVLVAKWEIKSFWVSFLDYYGNTVSNQTVNWGESAIAPSVDSIVGKQKFNGWSADFSKVYEDMTVNALYVDNTYTIRYDLGDVGESFTEPCFYGEIPKIPQTPVISGYVFLGWFIDEEMNDSYFFDYKFDRDVTLYAKFYDTTLGEYIVISNVEQFKAIKDQPDAKYLLACDINCHGEKLAPINSFLGEFDGNGYKIFNFTISETANYAGLVNTNQGIIRNLSLSDFAMNVFSSNNGDAFYGVIAAINYGEISNCHVLGGELKINNEVPSDNVALLVGGLIGMNGGSNGSKAGIVKDCTNAAYITVDATHNCSYNFYLDVGGVVGRNQKLAEISNCANYGDVFSSYCVGAGRGAPSKVNSAGGIAGGNFGGKIYNSFSTGDVTTKIEDVNKNYISYVYAGGGVGLNQGEVYNCYSTGNVRRQGSASVSYLGGFVGYNELANGYIATITKSFSTGSIQFDTIIDRTIAGYGYFAGNSTGTIEDCYYLDKAEIVYKTVADDVENNEEKAPTCADGEAKVLNELTSVDFIENILCFDRMIWLMTEGQLPTLR